MAGAARTASRSGTAPRRGSAVEQGQGRHSPVRRDPFGGSAELVRRVGEGNPKDRSSAVDVRTGQQRSGAPKARGVARGRRSFLRRWRSAYRFEELRPLVLSAVRG